MSTRPVLSICIPTFNRLHYLKEILETLLPQAELLGVEVCISDNNSSDGTAQFLKDLANFYPCLQYIIKSANIGLDRNMLAAITMGKGRYIYPIGDDDMLPDGTLLEILGEIENGGNALVLNGWHTTQSLVPKWMHLSPSIANRSFSRSDEAFVVLWDKMPFGSFLAKRELFQEKYFKRFIGTSHAYTGAVWDALAEIEKNTGSCDVRCMKIPTVLLRGGEKSWRNNAAMIMLYEIPHWFSLIMEKNTYKKNIPAIRNNFLENQTKMSVLIHFRAIGQLGKNDVSKLGKECNPEQVRKLRRVASVPRVIAQIALKTHGEARSIVKMVLGK
jgi:glycosyltransferase involved in cell wall biosynthesis